MTLKYYIIQKRTLSEFQLFISKMTSFERRGKQGSAFAGVYFDLKFESSFSNSIQARIEKNLPGLSNKLVSPLKIMVMRVKTRKQLLNQLLFDCLYASSEAIFSLYCHEQNFESDVQKSSSWQYFLTVIDSSFLLKQFRAQSNDVSNATNFYRDRQSTFYNLQTINLDIDRSCSIHGFTPSKPLFWFQIVFIIVEKRN